MWVTSDELADDLKISRQAVNKAVRDGRLKRHSGPKPFDLEECRLMFKMNSHPGKQASARAQAGHKKRANTQGAPPHPMNAHESAPPADDELRILTEDELATAMPSEVIRQKEIENVLAKRRENRERDGELVEALGERLRAQALAQEVRDKILDVPGQIAALLAAESDELKVHSMMTDALIAALERLADGNTERV